MSDIELARAALAALKNSYSPYSGFSVGAALPPPAESIRAAILKTPHIRRGFAPKGRRFPARFRRGKENLSGLP